MLHAKSKMERQRSSFCGSQGQKYKLWCSGNYTGSGGVGILMKKKIFANIVEVRRKSVRVMTILLILGEEVIRIVFASEPHTRRPDVEKVCF